MEVHTRLEGHSSGVLSVAFNDDGSELASGSDDKSVRVWKIENGETIQTLNGHSGSVYLVCYGRDSDILVSGSYDKTI